PRVREHPEHARESGRGARARDRGAARARVPRRRARDAEATDDHRPRGVAQRAYARHWARNYSPDDPRYVATIDEDLAFIKGVTTARLRDFHKDFFGASNAEVVVIGDFDPEQVRALLAGRLDGWKSPKPFSDVLTLYADLAKDPTTKDFNTPDKENAVFVGGMRIEMRDSHPDYPALVFGNYILGSGPASRLFGRIRGREGLSYGVGSSLN